MIYTHQKHIRFDEDTEAKYQRLVKKLWSDKRLPGKPRDSEGHRLVVHALHDIMFTDPKISINSI